MTLLWISFLASCFIDIVQGTPIARESAPAVTLDDSGAVSSFLGTPFVQPPPMTCTKPLRFGPSCPQQAVQLPWCRHKFYFSAHRT
ncbi:hypothetical protein JB92DRAFT_2974756 [Gautieria morchelliformis]|nr:hypothetical protein JB92DRAFT_2974756 [Gautieria morchelliformis]